MKNLILTVFIALCVLPLFAQNIEEEIRKLEQEEVLAVLQKDTVMLLKLWDKDYVVNAPDNKINFAGKTTLDRPVLTRSRVSFTREVEHVIVRGNTVFSMGSETLAVTQGQPVVKRRYTNIWMKQNDVWKLMARHANVICQ
jgi:ketosteroid isomerase-like protein